MTCCPPGAAPYLAAEHTDEGVVASVDDVSYYQVGSGPAGLLLIPDIWGWNGGRTRAFADALAKKGLQVRVPKLLPAFEGGTDGDGLPPAFDLSVRGGELGALFKGDWNAEKTVPMCMKVLKSMQKSGITRIGHLGFCYGAWIGMRISKEFKFVAAASPHPSVHIEGMVGGSPAAVAAEASCPWALFPCGEVGGPGGDPDIYDVGGDLFTALEKKFPGKNVTKRYSKMSHGFAPRGDIKKDEVKEAVQEIMDDIVRFFKDTRLVPREKSDPPKKRKPKFGKVAKIEPEAKGLNLMLKCVECTEGTGGDGSTKLWKAKLGDDTGAVTFSLRSAEHAALCKPGASLRVQNAHVKMVDGYIQVIVDKWAVLKSADDEHTFEVGSKDLSAVQYELA